MTEAFFRADALTLAERLIGMTLVHRRNGVELCGIVTETEAYMGVTDRASHAYGGRRTERTETMYLPGGYAYVYRIYGMYDCMNVTAAEEGNPEAVLIRGMVPWKGKEEMLENLRQRSRRRGILPAASELTEKALYALTNGPGKLCNAMAIGRELDKADLRGGDLFLRDDGWRAERIGRSPRIGIDYSGEATSYPWRFFAECRNGSPVLVRDSRLSEFS